MLISTENFKIDVLIGAVAESYYTSKTVLPMELKLLEIILTV